MPTVRSFTKGERKLVMVTAYDYATARWVDQAGVDAILVGDSVGTTVQGRPDTISVTLDQMVYHTEMVSRGAPSTLVIGDLPFMSYQPSVEEALRSAGRLMKEGRCQAVKLEGAGRVAESVERMVEAGIPVMGHLGLTPQSVHALGGHRTQGRTLAAARKLISDAEDLEAAGAFAVVLEYVPTQLAGLITERLSIPTIGIGSGPACAGQVLVFHDLLGLGEGKPMRHTMVADNLGERIRDGVGAYARAVREGTFPQSVHASNLDPQVLDELVSPG
jgi:3-methyl-2-oxobutanoate hydroxymethyltransferase